MSEPDQPFAGLGTEPEPEHEPEPEQHLPAAPQIDPFYLPDYIPLSYEIDIKGKKDIKTDGWNADRFCDRFCLTVRYCNPKKQYYIWNGRYWEPDRYGKICELCELQITEMIKDHSAQQDSELLKHLIKSRSPSGVRGMMFFLEANRLTVREEEIDADPDRVNVLNGVINLSTVQYEEPNRDRFITKMMNVRYDPSAPCPLWRDHLSLIFAGDQDTIDSFQMIAGYALLRKNPEQLFFILYGRGLNGKSVTLNVLAHILGEYCMNADPRTFMHRRSDDTTVRSDIHRLYPAHMITAIESSEGVRLNDGLIKQITGSDKLTSRELYGKEEELKFGGKIFFCTNHEPVIKDSTHGMLRRIIKIPFTVQIPIEKRDDRIEEKLIAEASGVFNWLLDGLRAWHANGRKIRLSKAITDSTAAYRDKIDEDREFFADDIESTRNPEDRISKKDLFEYYRLWYSDRYGEQTAISLKEFNMKCNAHGIMRDHRGRAGYEWIGIKHISALERETRKSRESEEEEERKKKRGEDIKKIQNAIASGVKCELVNLCEPYPINSFMENNSRNLLDKVHGSSQVHGSEVNDFSAVHMQQDKEPVYDNHKEPIEPVSKIHMEQGNEPTAPGFLCGSTCGKNEREHCKSDPSKCGRGIRS